MKRCILFVMVLLFFLCSFAGWAWCTTYEYDDLHRLVRVDYDDGTSIIYTYDSNGNRAAKIVIR